MTTRGPSVGLVAPRYPPASGGIELHVQKLARGLTQANVNVEVVTTDPTRTLPVTEVSDGVLIHRFPTIGNDSVYFVAPELGLWLMHHAPRFNLLHAHSYHTPLALQAALAGRLNSVPLVITPHYHGTGHSLFRQMLHLPYRFIGKWLIKQARLLICVSSAEQALLYQHFGPSISSTVIPNGVDVDGLLSTNPRDKYRNQMLILTVGRLENYKQTDRIVAALPFLPSNYQLVIVGDGPALPRINRLIERHQLHNRVQLTSRVSQAELYSWYRTADVFVSLSRKEAFGMSVLEAAVAGSPVVASDIAAHREVASYTPSGRFFFTNHDCSPSALAEVILQAIQREHISDTSNWPVPTWDTVTRRVLESYQAVLGGRCLN